MDYPESESLFLDLYEFKYVTTYMRLTEFFKYKSEKLICNEPYTGCNFKIQLRYFKILFPVFYFKYWTYPNRLLSKQVMFEETASGFEFQSYL